MSIQVTISGNFSCANRGDLAILRGLLNIINEDANKIQIITKDVANARSFLGLEYKIIEEDSVVKSKSRIYRNLYRLFILLGLFRIARKFSTKNKQFEKVYFVGGAYFIETYGVGKLDLLAYFLNRSHNVQLIGHSVGPFQHFLYKKISKNLYKECTFIGVRDIISLESFNNTLNLKKNIQLIPDTAFAFIPELLRENIISKKAKERTTIGITVRELSPFDKILNISQQEYNNIFLNLVQFLLSKGIDVVVVSMCTPLNGYHKDDRSTAKEIFDSINDENFKIIEDELSDLEIGEVFKSCDLVIGTRLHSCIISMGVGTHAIAVYYEHKSLGIYQKMGLIELSKMINELENHEEIFELIKKIIVPSFRENLRQIVNAEREFLNNLFL